MVLTIYGYVAAWGLPDISPYVTKVCYFMKMNGIEYKYQSEDLSLLDKNSPYGKLPYIVDDDGTKVGDSNEIIAYLTKKHNLTLDNDLSKSDRAVCLAFERMLAEFSYWTGVIQPRWREDEGWEVYIPAIVQNAEVTKPLREALDAFRQRILSQFNGQGMGRRPAEIVHALYMEDIDAISDFMGDKKYFYGDKAHGIDAMVYGMLRHFADQPQKWAGTGYVESKKNLTDYMERMRQEYGM